MTNEEIIALADSLLFDVNDEEIEETKNTIEFIKKEAEFFSKLNLKESMTHPFDLNEVTLRNDEEYNQNDDFEELFKNTSNIQGREVKVPRVVKE